MPESFEYRCEKNGHRLDATHPFCPMDGSRIVAIPVAARTHRDIPAQITGLLPGAVVALLVAAVLVLPVGPNVAGADLERSLQTEVMKDGPPSNGPSWVECSHGVFSSKSWNCETHISLALISDANATYKVNIDDANCWSADQHEGDPEANFLPDTASGCIR